MSSSSMRDLISQIGTVQKSIRHMSSEAENGVKEVENSALRVEHI